VHLTWECPFSVKPHCLYYFAFLHFAMFSSRHNFFQKTKTVSFIPTRIWDKPSLSSSHCNRLDRNCSKLGNIRFPHFKIPQIGAPVLCQSGSRPLGFSQQISTAANNNNNPASKKTNVAITEITSLSLLSC
jgi:hypothetical protein